MFTQFAFRIPIDIADRVQKKLGQGRGLSSWLREAVEEKLHKNHGERRRRINLPGIFPWTDARTDQKSFLF